MPPQNEHAWKRGAIGSSAYYVIALAGTLAAVIIGVSGGRRLLAVAALALMAAWYLVAGRSSVRTDRVTARATWYLAGQAVLLMVAQAATPWSSFILFVLCPQCFVLLPAWWATGAMAVFSLVPILRLVGGHPGLALAEAGIALAGVGFAATFGRWIMRIIE